MLRSNKLLILFLFCVAPFIGSAQTDLRDKNLEVQLLGELVNTNYDEISPIITPDGRSLFVARRNYPQNNKKGTFTDNTDIYVSKLDGSKNWKAAEHLNYPLNQRQFNSVESVSSDGSVLYIRGAYKNGKYRGNGVSRLYKVGNIYSLPNKIKIKGFNRLNKGQVTNFFFSNDAKILLLSFSEVNGGTINDIYVSFAIDSNEYTKPISLNYPVNTKKYSEEIPFLASDNETLYFSSDREGGYGLNDIWMSRRLDNTWINWTEPIVINQPINSEKWEGYCSVDAQGEYIYYVTYNSPFSKSADVVKTKLGDAFRPKKSLWML
jgi:OmpA-OmpF porin, OOP family